MTTETRSADLDVVWALADSRGQEIQALSRRCMQLAVESARLRERLARIAELHTDSVAGVCPSCGRIGEQSFDDDGLVNWPCPTVLIANPAARLIEVTP